MANLLTLFRLILLIPFLTLAWHYTDTARWWMLGLFLMAAITDIADGKIARARGETSNLGALLDLVADRLWIVTVSFVLIAIYGADWHLLVPLLIFVAREILTMSLREIADGKDAVPDTVFDSAQIVTQGLAFCFFLSPLESVTVPAFIMLALATLLSLLKMTLQWRSAQRYLG